MADVKSQADLALFIQKIKDDHKIRSLDLLGLNQTLLLPLFQKLGWNTLDISEVTPEFSRSGTDIRYLLRLDNMNAVIVKLTSSPQAPDGEPEDALLASPPADSKLLSLTNGIKWQFSLPKKAEETWWLFFTSGQRTAKPLLSLDIDREQAKDTAAILHGLLSKEQVRKGEFEKVAESYNEQVRKQRLEETLLETWNQLIARPSPILAEILAATAEKVCGFKPDHGDVVEFLKSQRGRLPPRVGEKPNRLPISEPPPPREEPLPPEESLPQAKEEPQAPVEETTVSAEEITSRPSEPSVTSYSSVILQWGRKLASNPGFKACKDRNAVTALLQQLAGDEFSSLPVDQIVEAAGNIYFFSIRPNLEKGPGGLRRV